MPVKAGLHTVSVSYLFSAPYMWHCLYSTKPLWNIHPYILHLKINGPDNQIVGCLLTDKLHVFLKEQPCVVPLLVHAVLLYVLLVCLEKVGLPLALLLLSQFFCRLCLLIEACAAEAIFAKGVHVPRCCLVWEINHTWDIMNVIKGDFISELSTVTKLITGLWDWNIRQHYGSFHEVETQSVT